jgi:hypothetical protein
MKRIITNRMFGPERSFCAGVGGMAVADHFRANGISRCSRFLIFSPVPIIRQLLAALKTPAGWRNKSNQPHRNLTSTAGRWRPPDGRAFRCRPLAWRKRFYRAEFIGLGSSRQYHLSG